MNWSEADLAALKARRAGKPAQKKYRNVPVEVDGLRFDSKREAHRWYELGLEQRAGHISNLTRQVRFPLKVNDILVCTYVADFVYQRAGQQVVEDSKGHRTREYILKRKLMAACLGIAIIES